MRHLQAAAKLPHTGNHLLRLQEAVVRAEDENAALLQCRYAIHLMRGDRHREDRVRDRFSEGRLLGFPILLVTVTYVRKASPNAFHPTSF